MKEKTFNTIWDKGIAVKARQIVDDNRDYVDFDLNSKKRILNEYNKLRDFTKISYMDNPDGLLDRHKVCACLIIAIIKAKPLIYNEANNVLNMKAIYNENLAMTVGLSVLRQYIITKGDDLSEMFKEGFVFPKTNFNAKYQELTCLMLNYDVAKGNYSILALANILFMIEEYSKLYFEYNKIRNDE